MIHKQYYVEQDKVEQLIARKNQKSRFYNGIYDRYRYPVLTRKFIPVSWRYDVNEETNVYDMRLTRHEDGWIYGIFCSESKDPTNPDLSAAVAAAGIVRTKDLKHWERLDNLRTLQSPQQRNVVLHPEFVEGKYAFYTRPMDGFIETGSGRAKRNRFRIV